MPSALSNTRVAALGAALSIALLLSACSTATPPSGGDATSPEAPKVDVDVAADEALAARVPADIRSTGTLTVGSDTSYPPSEFLGGPDGRTAMGLDVDLAKAIAGKLDLKLDFQTAGFDSILPALGTKYDLGISAFSVTTERMEAVDFVSYLNAGEQWAVAKDNPKDFDPNDVCGAVVGVQTGTNDETLVQEMDEACTASGDDAIDIQAFGKQTDIVTRIISGALDATLAGSTIIGYTVAQTEQLETIGDLVDSSPNGIAVKKGETEWSSLIADTVNALIADGVYAEIVEAWMGEGGGEVTEALINPDVEG